MLEDSADSSGSRGRISEYFVLLLDKFHDSVDDLTISLLVMLSSSIFKVLVLV